MERITLNIVPKGITPVCHASQYDKGREIGLDLMDGLQGFVLSGTETLELRVRKPDNNIVTAAVENTSSASVVFETTEQMTACEGVNLCELRITDGNDVLIGSLNFKMKVEVDPLKDGIESETEIHNLETQIADIVSDQYDSENVIFDSTPTAGHGNGYTVTSEGIKDALDAINNPDASAVNYDNTESGLTATNVQDALDEVVDVVDVCNDNFADAYDPTATYNTGSVCIYNNVLYICTADNITGTFDTSKWTATTVQSLIGDLSQLTTTDKSSVVGAVNEVKSGITDLQTDKSNALMVSTTALSINYGGARYKSQNIDVARTGYTVLGVVGYSLSSIDNIVFSIRMSSTPNTLVVGIQTRDGSNSNATITGYVDVLYVKN